MRAFWLLCAGILAVSASACNKSDNTAMDSTAPTEQAAPEATDTAAPAPAAEQAAPAAEEQAAPADEAAAPAAPAGEAQEGAQQ
jgi:light-harvesting protein B-800-850 alpha chain